VLARISRKSVDVRRFAQIETKSYFEVELNSTNVNNRIREHAVSRKTDNSKYTLCNRTFRISRGPVPDEKENPATRASNVRAYYY